MENLYDILGVKKDATQREIKRAYWQLALKLHPDRNPDKSAHAQFNKVKEAYDILYDELKRKKYDETGTADNRSMDDIIAAVVKHHITHIVNSDIAPPDNENIIKGLKKVTEDEIAGIKRNQLALDKKKKNAEKIKGRIIYKGVGKNLFAESLDLNISEFEKLINAGVDSIRQREEFISYLESYEYKIEEKKEAPIPPTPINPNPPQ